MRRTPALISAHSGGAPALWHARCRNEPDFQKQKRPHITGTKVRRVNADDLAKILIPIPSPEQQARIADILDKFDTLINSLTEGLPREIELRQKQYEHYRDLLLNFPKPEAMA